MTLENFVNVSACATPYSFGDQRAPRDALTEQQLECIWPIALTPLRSQPQSQTANLGKLQRLPLEILHQVLDHLSIPSLINFRNSNRYARFILDSHPAFKRILKFAPHTIRGLHAINTSVEISLSFLYQKLLQRDCERCESSSHYLWLPTASRLCHKCIYFTATPMRKSDFSDLLPFKEEDLESVPSFRFIPNTFVDNGLTATITERHTLYDTAAAAENYHQRTGRWLSSDLGCCVLISMYGEKTTPCLTGNVAPRCSCPE